MSTSRTEWNDDIEKLEDELALYKSNLTKAIKIQTEKEKKLSEAQKKLNEAKKNHQDEKSKLNQNINTLKDTVSQLEDNLQIAKDDNINLSILNTSLKNQVNELIYQLEVLQNELMIAKEQINSQSSNAQTATVSPSNTATEPKQEAQATTKPAAATTYGMFSPWRVLGYKNQETKPVENPAQKTLSDLTKASVQQALAEKSASFKL